MLLLRVLVLLLLPVVAFAQTTLPHYFASGTITANGGSVASNALMTSNGLVVITGTWVGTLQFEGTLDNSNWFALPSMNISTTALTSSTVATGQWQITTPVTNFRVRASAWTSGTATIQVLLVAASKGGGTGASGGGSTFGSSGVTNVCDTNTSAAVTFVSAAPSADYGVALGTIPISGSPPNVVANVTNRTVNGFTVNTSVAPGSGNCVGVSWQVGGTLLGVVGPAGPTGATGAPGANGNAIRTCSIIVGANDGAVLGDTNLGPQNKQCFVPAAATVVEVTVAADAGTPSVQVGKVTSSGSATNLLSSALTTASSGGVACSNVGATTGIDGITTCTNTLTTTALAAGVWLQLVSGTAGGVAKQMSVNITYTMP